MTPQIVCRATAVAAMVLALAGCGGEKSSDTAAPKASGLVETLPSCAKVWVTGETLGKDYDGCVIKGNQVHVFSPGKCPSGAEYTDYDRYYTVVGEAVQESASGDVYGDKAFLKLIKTC